MNREQRRSKQSRGYDINEYLNSPCSITEATQIARGVAEDVVSDYNYRQGHLQIAISLQIEILKDIVISSGLITEEEFKNLYVEKAVEFDKKQKESLNNSIEDPKVDMKTDGINITLE